jgi:outer membrane receptor for ferrienterochelin and colicins
MHRPPIENARRLTTTLAALTAALILASWLAPVARAQLSEVADEAEFHFERGNQFYRQGRYEEALAAYYASNRLVPNRNVQFNIARCLEQLKRYPEAFRAWSSLDASNPPETERANIRAAIDRLRSHLALLEVETQPPGALIFVNRRDLGSHGASPKLLALPEGRAKIILDRAGFRSEEVDVELVRGKAVKLIRALARIYGQVELQRLPPGADVRRDFVDGEVLRRGPGRVRLEPGRRVLFASAEGHQTVRLEVEVRADDVVRLDVPLPPAPPPTGALVVRANIDGALVRVDGREMGFTPAVIEGIVEGDRNVEILKDGRQPFSKVVKIQRGERAYLDVRLIRAEPEVMAATKKLSSAEEAPASITVITAEEIAAFGWTTLAQALSGVRGVFSSNDRAYEAVGFRGFSPPGDYTNRVLVLLDGHPYNDIMVGQGFVGHDVDVDLTNVERIEVVRGPGSVLYGTGALFGVINVVSKRAARGAHAGLSGTTGSLGLTTGRATVSSRGELGEVAVSGGTLRQLGDRRFSWPDGATVVRLGDVEEVSHADLSARLGPVSLRAGFNRRHKQLPTGAFEIRPEPGSSYEDTRAFSELRLDRAFGEFRFSARAAYDLTRFDGYYQLVSDVDGQSREDIEDQFRSQWVTGEVRLELPSLLGQRFTVGSEVQSQFEIDLGDPSRTVQKEANSDRELVLSAYLVDDVALSSRLRVNLGLRADHYRHSFGTTLNPRVAIIGRPYQVGNTKLLVGRAFRAPSPYERFYNDGGETQTQAGPLDPETILSLELEHTHRASDDISVVGSVFTSQVENLIVLSETTGPSGASVLAYENNDGVVRSLGAEGEVRWEPGGGTTLVVAYSWQRVRALSDGGSEPFPNAPVHLVSVRSVYALVPALLRLGNEMVYDAGRYTREGERLDDAIIWNVTASGEYRPWRLRYFAGIFNLLDVRSYSSGFPAGEEIPFATVPRYGRSARVGLSFAY